MDDFRLKVFIAAARNLSFTKAAEELFISQPAISKHIAFLESTYGVRLFDRRGSSLSLTLAGQILLDKATRIQSSYDELDYTMHLLTHAHMGKLRIGASTTIAQYVIARIIARFNELYPQVEVSLVSGNSRFIESALDDRLIDLGMVEGVHHASHLQYRPFMDDALCVVASPRHSYPTPVTEKTFLSLPLVLRERGSGTLEVIENELSHHHLKLSDCQVRLYLGSTEAIKLYLRNSQAVGIISRAALENELTLGQLTVLPLSSLSFKRSFSLVMPRGPLPPLAESFAAFTMDNCQPSV